MMGVLYMKEAECTTGKSMKYNKRESPMQSLKGTQVQNNETSKQNQLYKTKSAKDVKLLGII